MIRIFLFHRVNDKSEPWAPAMPVARFEKCVRFISKRYEVRTIESIISNKISSNDKPLAAITFDDGFKDNIQHAAPILDKYKCKASFYVVTDSIDQNIPTWPHLYDHAFINTQKLELKIELPGFGGIDQKFASSEERISFGKALFKKLKVLSYDELQGILVHIRQAFNDVPTPTNCMMNWEDIKQLASAGHEIGSHTKSHPLLSTIKDNSMLSKELSYSRERIKQMTGVHTKVISYPVGNFNEHVFTASVKAGYVGGLIVGQKFYKPEIDNIMGIPRMDVYSDGGWLKTYLRMTGRLNKLKKILGK